MESKAVFFSWLMCFAQYRLPFGGHLALSTCGGQYIGISQDEWTDPLAAKGHDTGFEWI